MKKKITQKGFTLIELLIVIAIIGILAGVILVSTSSARNKANIAAVQQSLSSLKAGVASCCLPSTTNTLGIVAGGAICSDATITGTLPVRAGGATLAYAATFQCVAANPTYTVTPTGTGVAACDAGWTVTMSGITKPAGC